MEIKKIIEKNKFKIYLITLPEPVEIEVQLDKDKELEIISFDRFLLMTEKELNEKEIEINSLQFLEMLEGTDIPVMIEIDKSTFGDFSISREKREEMTYKIKMPDDKELEKIVLDEKTKEKMALLIKSWSETDFELFNNSNETEKLLADLKENEIKWLAKREEEDKKKRLESIKLSLIIGGISIIAMISALYLSKYLVWWSN